MTERLPRVTAQQRRRLTTVLWAGAAAAMTACSYDWDRLEPARGTSNDSAGAPNQASGGLGGGSSAGGGGSSTGGGGSGTGGSGTAAGGTAASCSGSVLTNSDFEDTKPNQPPRDWLVLNNAPNVEPATESTLYYKGSNAMSVDTRSAEPSGAYRALIGNTSGRLTPSSSGAELSASLAVRVEKLPSGGAVSLLALFRADSSSDFQELELKTLSATGPSYTVVPGTAQLPAGTTEFGLAISVPAGALVYIDEACAAVE